MKNDLNDNLSQNPYLSDDISQNYSFENIPESKYYLRVENTNDTNLINQTFPKYISNQISNTSHLNNFNKSLSYTSYLPADYITTQDRNYLKFRNEELNKELLNKIGENQILQDKIKSLENIVLNLQKTIQGYHEKLACNEKLKIDINLRTRKINELEEEINIQKAENIKLTNALNGKNNTISEFEGLIKISKEKFDLFEETNKNLNQDNNQLKEFIDELQNKLIESKNCEKEQLNTIYELKNINNDLINKEKEYISLLEENENRAKERLHELECLIRNDFSKEKTMLNKTIEQYKLDNDKLKYEVRNIKCTYDNIEKEIHEKEVEFHRIVDKKDEEYNSLHNTLRELQLNMQDLEMDFNLKIKELNSKIYEMEENEIRLKCSIGAKDKVIADSEGEIANFKTIFENCQKSLIDLNHQLKLKDEIIERLRTQFNEVLTELNKNESTFKHYQEVKNEEFGRVIQINNELLEIKEKLIEERQDIIRKNELLSRKVSDLTDLLENKYKRVEGDMYRERANRDITEKTNRELLIKINENEEKFNVEMNKMRNFINSKEKEFEMWKSKMIGKLEHNLSILQENEHVKKSLLNDLKNIKDWAINVEKHLKSLVNIPMNQNLTFRNEFIETLELNPNHREILNNIKDIIKKIEGRINYYDADENNK